LTEKFYVKFARKISTKKICAKKAEAEIQRKNLRRKKIKAEIQQKNSMQNSRGNFSKKISCKIREQNFNGKNCVEKKGSGNSAKNFA
jgi:hypothetical protein